MRSMLGIVLVVALFVECMIIAAAQNQPLKFEVASVKSSPQSVNVGVINLINGCSGTFPRVNPGRFTVTGATLYTLITWAYSMGECLNVSADGLVSGGPAWIMSDRFDIQANIPQGLPAYTTEGIMRGNAPKLASMPCMRRLSNSICFRSSWIWPTHPTIEPGGGSRSGRSAWMRLPGPISAS